MLLKTLKNHIPTFLKITLKGNEILQISNKCDHLNAAVLRLLMFQLILT